MSQTQVFQPPQWVGNYSFPYGETGAITLDIITNRIVKSMDGTPDNIEATGLGQHQVMFSSPVGFGLRSDTSNQALLDAYNWIYHDFYSGGFNTSKWFNRPVGLGWYSQDNSSASSCQPVFSGVGYLNFHLEHPPGRASKHYDFPYRFEWIRAWKQILVALVDSGDHQNYTFNLSAVTPALQTGYLAGFLINGTNVTTAANAAQFITNIKNPSGSVIGAGPLLGVSPNQAFGSTITTLISSGAPLTWPCVDGSSLNSIQFSVPPAVGNYSVSWGVAWSTLPTIFAIWVPA
jgi:hypothetical protein